MADQTFNVRSSGGGVGAFVEGLDVSAKLAPQTIAALNKTLGDNGVLFFRDQKLTPDQHIAFAEQFAKINVNRFFKAVDGYPGIAEVRKEADQERNIGGGWHTDHTYDVAPAMGSILLAREVPTHGGDTLFSNMYAAFDGLSSGLQQTLEGMSAVHTSRHVFGDQSNYAKDAMGRIGNAQEATQDAVHPVVIKHPTSGRPALFVNRAFTVRFDGWTEAESKPLLEMLYEHASRPEYTYRFQWQPGSIAFWDNRASWHYALNDYAGERRLMHRITLEGVALDGTAHEIR